MKRILFHNYNSLLGLVVGFKFADEKPLELGFNTIREAFGGDNSGVAYAHYEKVNIYCTTYPLVEII